MTRRRRTLFPDAASSVGFGTSVAVIELESLTILHRHPVHVRHGHASDGFDVIVGRVSPLGGKRLRPDGGEIGNRVAPELRGCNL